VLFIGESRQLIESVTGLSGSGWFPWTSRTRGYFARSRTPTDVLDGFCTPFEANLLQRVQALGLPCLTPTRATAYLASVVSGRATTRV
jgi:hypothetical protein